MKFVGDTLTFSSPSEDGSEHRVRLAIFHRAAVGVFPGTKVFAVPLVSTNEIILTPIDPATWGDLWRLEATVSDEPGSAKALVQTLVENNVNVLVHEGVSESTERGTTVHRIFEILDLTRYAHGRDGTTDLRNSVEKTMLKPNCLINRLVTNAEHCLALADDQAAWDLRFSRMEFFHGNKENRVHKVGLTVNVEHEIQIPTSLMRDMPHVADPAIPVALHIISDTEQKYVKLRVLSPQRYYLLVEIEHVERVGAIDSFMTVLREHGANIIDSYSRLKSVSNTASFYALAEFGRRMTKPKLLRFVNELVSSESAREVRLRGAFGAGPRLEKRLEKDLPAGTIIKTDMGHPRPPAPPTDMRRISAEAEARGPGADQQLIVAGDALGAPYFLNRRGSERWVLNKAEVFMAIPFDEAYLDFYEDVIVPAVRSSGLDPVRVDRLQQEAERRHLVDRIEEGIARSRFVVADLSGWNPNIVYEVGLAASISKPVLAICDATNFDNVPFDFRSYQLIKYQSGERRSLREQLTAMIDQMKEATEPLVPMR